MIESIIEEKKTKALNMGRGFVWTVVIISSLLLLFFAYQTIRYYSEDRFEMFLDGEEVDSVDVCALNWSYEDLEFIPCVDQNNTGGGILSPFINWTLSPQDNCAVYGWGFPGFNIDNITRAEELYLKIIPKCNTLHKEEIIMPWIKGNCECYVCKSNKEFRNIDGDLNCLEKEDDCEEFKCGDNLIIKRK